MTSRRGEEAPLSSHDQINHQVDELHHTVQNMRRVSEAIHEELEAHNDLLSGLSDRYNSGMDALSNLLAQMKALYISTGWSPLMLTMFFCAAVVVFLWLYWKIKA
jgi:hypothetical protein